MVKGKAERGNYLFSVDINPLTANDELSCHENLTFLWTWILRWVPRSFTTQNLRKKERALEKAIVKLSKEISVNKLNFGVKFEPFAQNIIHTFVRLVKDIFNLRAF